MGVFSCLISQELRPTYNRMSFGYKLVFLYVNLSDRYIKWYKVPVFLGLLYLELRRLLHQKYNLIGVGPVEGDTGAELAFIGRNMAPAPAPAPGDTDLIDPHPAVVATKLLNRKQLIDTGKQFNMIAASWINFMIHDWIDHLEDDSSQEILSAPDSVAAQCPLKSFKFYPSKEIKCLDAEKVAFINSRSSWWDSSMIYGSNETVESSLRTYTDGKLKINDDGIITSGDNGIPIIGDPRNPWMGVAVLQSLFVAEHNLVCDTLKAAHPTLVDQALFTHAKRVVQAVLAKIHTIDWTIELLKMNTLYSAMRANWYGLLGKWFKDHIGSTKISLLSGIIGAPKTVNHGVPYSLTEEFTSVYRMHPLLPENINIRDIRSASKVGNEPLLIEEVPVLDLIGVDGIKKSREYGMKVLLTSMGHQASGALSLFNYPTWMRDLPVTNMEGVSRSEHVDMPALEIYRDRSHRVSRYNQFRRSLLMPEIKRWEDLTDDADAILAIRELYADDVEKLDLLVGLLAEKKIPGYAISETAFFIFLLMATRRLEADPKFTTDFNEKSYTKEGLKWVNTTESLKDVLLRHHPEIVKSWMTSSSAFSLWSAPPNKWNPIPPYLRLP